jgi:hypothetical protein
MIPHIKWIFCYNIICRRESEEKFLTKILEVADELTYGFYSEAQWEIFLHVTIEPKIRELTNAKSGSVEREKSISYDGKRKSIDFWFVDHLTKNVYAIEFKVETSRQYQARYGSMNMLEAFRHDIDKLENMGDAMEKEIASKKKTKEYELNKWVVMITRSTKALNALKGNVRSLQGKEWCWTIVGNKGFVAALIKVDDKVKVCAKDHEYATSQLKSLKSDQWKPKSVCLKESRTENKKRKRKAVKAEMGVQEFIQEILLQDSVLFRGAINQKEAWEVYAQVLISKRLQCTHGIGYLEPIRELPYSQANLQGEKIDFAFTRGDHEYAIEMKVDVNGKFMKLNPVDALEKEIAKLGKWKPESPCIKRWVVLIMEENEEHCKAISKWLGGDLTGCSSWSPGVAYEAKSIASAGRITFGKSNSVVVALFELDPILPSSPKGKKRKRQKR